MTDQEQPEEMPLDVALSAAKTSFEIAVRFLEREAKALRPGEEPNAELDKSAKTVNASLQTFLKERDKFEQLTGSAHGGAETLGLNLARARSEIESRLARLRASRDP